MVVVAVKQLQREHAGAAKTAPRVPRLRLLQGDGQGAEVTPYRGTELRQTRQHYDPVELERLQMSIARQGLMNPVQIAQLKQEEARYYLRVWNRVWGTRYKLSQISKVEEHYEIVVAGHRRRRSGINLCEEGRPPKSWDIKFLRDIPPEEALEIQFQENVYSKPETWEDAEAVYRLWVFRQEVDRKLARAAKRRREAYVSDLNLTNFAERVGRSPDTVRDYIRFGEAPGVLQKAVRSNRVAYGKGILLARAHKAGAISLEILREHWLPLASLPGLSVESFEKAMEARLEAARNRQEDLFGTLDVEAVAKAYESDRKAIVYPELIGRIHETTAYWARVRELDEDGKFGEDGPFSAASPNRVFVKFIEEMEATLPHLRQLSLEQRQQAERVLAEFGAHLDELGPSAGSSQKTLSML